MSALFLILLQVEVKSFLPNAKVSILVEGHGNLTDADPGQIGWASHKYFDSFSESLLILLEQ